MWCIVLLGVGSFVEEVLSPVGVWVVFWGGVLSIWGVGSFLEWCLVVLGSQ